MDAFYVSCELLRRPELEGKPVIISGSGPRAVVTTASYEARKFGVGSAMPTSQARRRCPQAILVPVDMAHYRAKSKQVMAMVDELGAPRERVSVDEVYLELTDVHAPIRAMGLLVKRIRDELSLDASVGIGPNKLVAKVASDAEKPKGFVLLTREQAAQRFAPEPVGLIPGIGPKTAERLGALRISTIADLQRLPVTALQQRFGERQGRFLHERAHFRDGGLVAERTAKSSSVETTFDTDVLELARLEAILRKQSSTLAASLLRYGRKGRTIAIKMRYDNFETLTRARSISEFTNDEATISQVALELLAENRPERPVRLLGVRVGSFESAEQPRPEIEQTSLPLAAA